MDEWRRSTKAATVDRAGTRERLASRMNAAVAAELDRLSRPPQHPRHRRLGGALRRPVRHGLGIMRSFTAIAGANNTSLAVVAPGIAEALFATAIGLFAAIPAVIAYNRLTHGLDRFEARLSRFADRFHATLSRELEVEVEALMGANLPPPAARPPRRAPMSEINVTPLVDVMLVLLIIFMVTAPLLVAGVPIDLPESRAGALDQQAKPVQVALDERARSSSTTPVWQRGAARCLARIAAQPATGRRPPHLPARRPQP